MKFFPSLTTSEKLKEARYGLIAGVALLAVGIAGWAIVLWAFDGILWGGLIFMLITVSGAYILWQTALTFVIDFTVGRYLFLFVAMVAVVLGGLMSMYELFTTP